MPIPTKSSLTEKVTKLEKQLEHEKTRFTQSALELENTRESMKTQQLMNMEMMDYERAVNELKSQVELKTNEADAAKQGKLLKLNLIFQHSFKRAPKSRNYSTKCVNEPQPPKKRSKRPRNAPRNIAALLTRPIASSLS